jgi:hypothetical protein
LSRMSRRAYTSTRPVAGFPAELTVVGVFVPLVINEFAVVWGGVVVKEELIRFASVTCVAEIWCRWVA